MIETSLRYTPLFGGKYFIYLVIFGINNTFDGLKKKGGNASTTVKQQQVAFNQSINNINICCCLVFSLKVFSFTQLTFICAAFLSFSFSLS
jgi:hypothetical protein